MSGWGFNLSNLKTLGDKLQDGLSELERNLAQPVVRNDPPPRNSSSSSSDQHYTATSPSRSTSFSTSSPSRASRPTPHALVMGDATPRGSVDSTRSTDTAGGVASPNAERSASDLATGAMSSLREQLRRKRLAAEAARNGGSPQPHSGQGSGLVAKPREESPAPDTPTKQPLLVDFDPAGDARPELNRASSSLMDAGEDEPLTPLTPVAKEAVTSIVDHHSALPSALQTPIQAQFSHQSTEPEPEGEHDIQLPAPVEPTPSSPHLATDHNDPDPDPVPTTTPSEQPPAAPESAPEPASLLDQSADALPFDVDPESSAAKDLLRPSSPDMFAIASTADATPLDAVTREGSPAPEAEAEPEADVESEALEATAEDAEVVVPEKEEPVAETGSVEKPVEPEEEAKAVDALDTEVVSAKDGLPVVEADEQEPTRPEPVEPADPTQGAEAAEEKEDDAKPAEEGSAAEPSLEPVPVSGVQIITSAGVDDPPAPSTSEEDDAEPNENGIPAVDESAPAVEIILEGRSIPDAVAPEEQLEQAKAEEEAEHVAQDPTGGEGDGLEEDAVVPLPAEESDVIEELIGQGAVEAEGEEQAEEPLEAAADEVEPAAAETSASSPEAEPDAKVEELAVEPAEESAGALDGPQTAAEPADKGNDAPQTYAEAVIASTDAGTEVAPAPVAKDAPSPSTSSDAPNGSTTAPPNTRFDDVTAAYGRLQALKTTLDRIVSEVTPLTSVDDVDAFEGELRNMKGKTEMSMSEIGKLTGDLKLQKERFSELRDAHRQESRSQTERIDDLSAQAGSKDAALAALAAKLEQAEAATAASKAEVAKLNDEAVKLRQTAKDEEEKRTKALSLLRALRQKLVKTEKDKDEAEKARDELQARAKEAGDGTKADRVRFEQEVVSLRAAQQSEIAKLRASFEKDVQAQKAALEREAGARKAQFELDAITAKAVHNKELQAREARVAQLEKTVKELGAARAELFDQLQVRTAEAESAGAHQQSLQGQTGELEYELQEARDKAAALLEEVDELRKVRRDVARDEVNVRRLLAEAEARHESKVRDLTARARGMEKERQEAADEASKQLAERLKEVERMRETIAQKDKEYAQSVSSAKASEARIAEAERRRAEGEKELKEVRGLLASVKEDQAEAVRTEAALREELTERASRSAEIEHRLEEVVAKESELRSKNKASITFILRDELRKLQSGVALRETARAPGVGYFAQHSQGTGPGNTAAAASTPGAGVGPASGPMSPQSENGGVASPTLSQSTGRGRTGSIYGGSTLSLVPGGTGADLKQASEEAINFEYLRNLLLQFLEKPEMRPHLISVMSVVMRFTPAEQRRLVAKAGGR